MTSFLSAVNDIKWSNKVLTLISNLTGSYSSVVELHRLHYLGKAIIHMDSVFFHRTCQWIMAGNYMPHPTEEKEIGNTYFLYPRQLKN